MNYGAARAGSHNTRDGPTHDDSGSLTPDAERRTPYV